MTEYLVAFNGEWANPTAEEMPERSKAVRALVAEMQAAGVFVFLGGLDPDAPVFSVDAADGSPIFTDGPYVESKEHLGGFAIVDVVTRMRRGCGPGRSRWPVAGHRRCDASSRPPGRGSYPRDGDQPAR